MSEQNKISFTVNNITAKKNHIVDGMVALKKIQHFSYVLSDEIGLGYSSKVYKGKNDKTNEQVAVKVIDIKKEDELHKQFTNDEVNVLERIKKSNAENLLRLEGVFKTKNNLYIITEFCEGKDMAKILRRKKTLSQPQAQGIMKQFLKGYAELYKLDVVHRDLKLANIFVTKGRVVLADFGFAIDYDRCGDKFDYNVGSPFYMPPESLKFNRYSHKSDVWAIGVIAFQLIYGNRPWKDRDDEVLFEKITNTRIDQLFDTEVEVSEDYKNFIRECLQIDYDKRATPEFVIGFQWNQAVEYVEGAVDEIPFGGGRPMSLVKNVQVHPNSAKHFAHKTMKLDEGQLRRLRVSDEGKHKQIPLSLLNRQKPSNTTINIFNKNPQSFQEGFQEQTQGIHSQPQSPQFPHIVDLKKKTSNLSGNIGNGYTGILPSNDADVQRTILSQVHYCRFLSLVLYAVNSSGISQISKLLPMLAQKINNILNELINLQYDQENDRIPGILNYLRNPRWKNLMSMIGEYQQKYQMQYAMFSTIATDNLSVEKVGNAITFLKQNFSQNQRIIQLLAYLYQVLEMENSKNLFQFSKMSKIQFLAQNKNLVHNSSTSQRLLKKLGHMGF